MLSLKHIPEAALYKSEPPPQWFGNADNERSTLWTNQNWLKSRFHFSFAEYNNPKNDHFGVLRVMNDDLVQPDRGFGAHPHRDMEIVTYIVEGELTHQDSMSRGEAQNLPRGSVQFMTAGTGIRHSEHNLSKERPLRFVQVWVTPNARGHQPRYGGFDGSKPDALAARKNALAHIVGDASTGECSAPVGIMQDCNFYCSELEEGRSVEFSLGARRQAYVLCIEGALDVQARGQQVATLARHDAAELRAEQSGDVSVVFTCSSGTAMAHLLLIEMAHSTSGGRRDL